jgi:YfiH family protein
MPVAGWSADSLEPGWLDADWPAPPGVRVITTLRGGGCSAGAYASLNLGDHVGDVAAHVAENRRRLGIAAQLPGEPRWLKQVHGDQVADLDVLASLAEAGAGGVPIADGAFTHQPGRICAILSADCLPVVLASESGDVVGVAHAGWRGLAGGVIEATVRAMRAAPATLVAWLGPAIGPEHYEVGGEVRAAFMAHDLGAAAAFMPSAHGRYMADLYCLARRRLRGLGVVRIFGGGECTHARPDRYFSHRRDGATGRQATLIWRVPG